MRNSFLKIKLTFKLLNMDINSKVLKNKDPKYYLDKCYRILYNFMNGSRTDDPYSQVIQILFIQQIKLTYSFGDLMWYKWRPGQDSIVRSICEVYIKIKWLLNSNIPDSFGPIVKKRIHKYIISSSWKLMNFHTSPELSYIKKSLDDAMNGKLYKYNIYQLKRNLNKVTHDLDESTYEMNLLLRVGINLQNEDINALIKESRPISIHQMTKDFSLDYKIYGLLCKEMHSYVPSVEDNNIKEGYSGIYYCKNNCNNYHDNPILIGCSLLFLTYTFYVIYKNDVFEDGKHSNVINNIAFFMKHFNKNASQIIKNNIKNKNIIKYAKYLEFY